VKELSWGRSALEVEEHLTFGLASCLLLMEVVIQLTLNTVRAGRRHESRAVSLERPDNPMTTGVHRTS
jgi:hypothetical protein